MKHIKFVGKTKDENGDYNAPIEKVLPAHMIGLQRYQEDHYWVEVHKASGNYATYRVEEKEYRRIEKELLNEEELPHIPQIKTESPYDRMEVE